MRVIAALGFAIFLRAALFGQAPGAELTFEVATMRASGQPPPDAAPVPPRGFVTGGPGTADPEQRRLSRVPILKILTAAFGVDDDQIQGPPWAIDTKFPTSVKYDIVAKVPSGATKEQATIMLQNLLKERLGLAFHRDKKEFTVFYLTIAEGGPKLKEPEPAKGTSRPTSQPPLQRLADYQGGMPQLPPGVPNIVNVVNSGHVYTAARMQSMANLVLGFQLPLDTTHIVDKTGLTGKYDFTLEYSAAGPGIVRTQSPNGAAGPIDNLTDPAPDLFTALEKQLGLTLTKSKMPLEVIVIDHIEKIPADN